MKGIAQGQLDIGKQFANIATGLSNISTPYLQKAGSYWSDILSGDKQKMTAAVAPAAEQVSSVYGGAERSLEAYLPRGGERNLAQANLKTAKASDIARLYAGQQPTAAGQLGALAGIGTGAGAGYGSVGSGYAGQGVGAGSSLLNYYSQQAGAAGQSIGGAAQGIGTYLGMKMGGCWVAFATFGNSARAWRLRYWMLERAPKWLLATYRVVGPSLAKVIERSAVAHRISYRSLAWAEAHAWG